MVVFIFGPRPSTTNLPLRVCTHIDFVSSSDRVHCGFRMSVMHYLAADTSIYLFRSVMFLVPVFAWAKHGV
jgi:hypothetical protein